MTAEIRWHYCFRNFSHAFSLLREALDGPIEGLTQLEREGVIQRFEFTFELSWQLLKDRLEYDGALISPVTPRNVIREAASTGLVNDGQIWEEMIEDRNRMSHRFDCDLFEGILGNVRGDYLPAFGELHHRMNAEIAAAAIGDDEGYRITETGLPTSILEQLRRIFSQYPDLDAVRLFGSYATGKATPRSDIDLATLGIIDRYVLGRLALDLEDLPIIQKCDVQVYESINYEPLRRHIDEKGITIYEKRTGQEKP